MSELKMSEPESIAIIEIMKSINDIRKLIDMIQDVQKKHNDAFDSLCDIIVGLEKRIEVLELRGRMVK